MSLPVEAGPLKPRTNPTRSSSLVVSTVIDPRIVVSIWLVGLTKKVGSPLIDWNTEAPPGATVQLPLAAGPRFCHVDRSMGTWTAAASGAAAASTDKVRHCARLSRFTYFPPRNVPRGHAIPGARTRHERGIAQRRRARAAVSDSIAMPSSARLPGSGTWPGAAKLPCGAYCVDPPLSQVAPTLAAQLPGANAKSNA